jgi:C-terminal processing protease CtpA/Prc
VAVGSIAERHGAQEGDVIKSINGHPVTSVQEAITFAKNHANEYTVWKIVVENKGKSRTVIYESPSQ